MKNMRNQKHKWMALFALFTLPLINGIAQEGSSVSPTDTIYPIVEQVQSDVNVMKRLKISGYIQAQYQKIDTSGMDSYAGGNFASQLDNRFAVRRGRIKFAYENQLSQYVLQFDVTEKGLAIKDAYAAFTEPWTKSMSLWTGVFNKPFGYEIEYSSNTRETPERSRMYQVLFPGERDLGAKLVFQPWKTSRFNYIKLDVGVFNGNGTNSETDQYKDMIAHITINKTFLEERLKVGIGASYYNGGVRKVTKQVYTITDVNTYNAYKSGVGVPADTATMLHTLKAFSADSTGIIGDKVKREYFGVETQISYDWALGLTTLRGEYLWGTQPGLATSSASFTALPTGDIYLRNFSGYYVNFVQNIMQTPFGIVLKYDSYDPNTDVSGDMISRYSSKEFPKNPLFTVKDALGTVTKYASAPIATTGAADIKYTTLGMGVMYRWNSSVRLTVYYDIVKNEKTSYIVNASTLKDYSKDRTDNVLTLRLQYKF
jgi:hypothetical protein